MESDQIQPPINNTPISLNPVNNSYLIVPSTSSMLINMVFVILFFIAYLVIIAYMSLYDSKNVPNLRMFIDFLVDNNTPISDLNNNIKQIIKSTPIERFSNMSNNELAKPSIISKFIRGISDIANNTQMFITSQLNKLVLKTYIQGKTIKTTHKIIL